MSKKMMEAPKNFPPISPPAVPKHHPVYPAVPHAGDVSNLSIKTEKAEEKKSLHFPVIEFPKSNEIIISTEPAKKERVSHASEEELRDFDEAIKSIHRDVMKITSDELVRGGEERGDKRHAGDEKEYYTPKSLGEGYFAEIQHFIKNKNAKEIAEEILKKDFLTGMKDYHEHKAQGKPFFIHSKDLEEKLERQIHALMENEEEWHELKSRIEAEEEKKKKLEQAIDGEAHELKALFKLIRANQVLEKEAKQGEEFILKGGQRLKCLNDLRKALTYMQDDEFSGYANQHKNDFANWARNALEIPEAAEKIRRAGSRKELEHALAHILE